MHVMGIIFASDANLGGLSDKRTMGSIPFGGRYRQVDFHLSNMAAAGIRHVGIISRKPQRDLTDPAISTGPTRMRPAMLDTIAAAFPDLKLLQGHMGIPWCNELFESLYYYPNISCSVSGLIDFKWLIENLDRCTEAKVPFAEKMMFAVDAHYGAKNTYERVVENAKFFKMFFEKVGGTYRWGCHGEDYLYNNARRFIGEFIQND